MAKPEELRIYNPPNADYLKLEQQTTAGTIVSYTIRNSANTPLSNADGSGSGIQVGTLATMLAIATPSVGQQFYVEHPSLPQFNKLCTYSGRTWQVVGETVELKCATNLDIGYVVEIDNSIDYAVEKSTSTADRDLVGIMCFQNYSASDWSVLATRGNWYVAYEAGSYSRGDRIKVDSTDGLAEDSGGTQKGVFGICLTDFVIASDGDLGPTIIFPVEKD